MGLKRILGELFIVQIFFFLVFVISGAIINILQLFTLPLWIINRSLFRRLNSYLVYLHWSEVVFLFDTWSGSQVIVHGDKEFFEVLGRDPILLVLNHKCDLDWLLTWCVADRMNVLHASKCYMKHELKFVPFVGWSLLMLEMPFLKRDFTKDKKALIEGMRMITEHPFPCVMLLFCEGTRYTKEKFEKSQAFAKSKGLPLLKHHLLPRTKGFSVAVEAFKGKVPYMIDGVVATEDELSLFDLFLGKKCTFHTYCKTRPLSEVPTDTPDASAMYCHKLYQGKDDAYDYFVKHKTFTGYDDTTQAVLLPKSYRPTLIVTMWFTLIGAPLIIYIWRLFMSGSTVAIVSAIIFVFLVHRLFQKMINVTVTAKGSHYGKDKEDPNTSTSLPENGTILGNGNHKTKEN